MIPCSVISFRNQSRLLTRHAISGRLRTMRSNANDTAESTAGAMRMAMAALLLSPPWSRTTSRSTSESSVGVP